jgi:hypothetical protein
VAHSGSGTKPPTVDFDPFWIRRVDTLITGFRGEEILRDRDHRRCPSSTPRRWVAATIDRPDSELPEFLFTVPRYISSSTLIVRKREGLVSRDIAMAVYSS